MIRLEKLKRALGIRWANIEQLERRRLLSATYYVSPSGNDAAAGTSVAPFATLQHAADLTQAGDTVMAEPGTYSHGFALGWNGTQNGTASAPITFDAQPGATITGANSRTADAIDLEGSSYVTVEGFTITNPNGAITRAGVRAVGTTTGNSEGVIVKNVSVTGAGEWGIFTAFTDDLLLQGNYSAQNNTDTSVASFNHHGIYVSNSSQRPVIRGNTVWGNLGNGIHLNGDASAGGTGIIAGALIEGNVIYDNGVNGGSAINCDGVQNSRIQNNLIYNEHASGISLYQIDGGGASTGDLVVNNTIMIAAGGRWDLNLASAATGTTAYNNILLNAGNGGSISASADSLSGLRSDYNVVMDRFTPDGNTNYTLSQWQSATGQDRHSLETTAAQLFVNPSGTPPDYHLRSNSPAIDIGGALASPNQPPLYDLDGNSRPQGAGYDIGAYEFAATAAAPAAPSNLAATAAGAAQINLSWTDNSGNETSFFIERSTDGVNFTQITAVGTNVTTYGDSGLAASTTYVYRVRAANSAGDSAYSNTASATTAAAGSNGVPATPSALTATAVSANQVKLSWTEPASNQTGFQIQRATGTGAYLAIGTAGATAKSYTDSNAAAGTSYSFRVVATNAAGASPNSNAATITSPWSFWSNSSKPGTSDVADSNPVEVGVQFQSSVSGYITGIRFYKGPTNTGTHVAHLWSATGQLLASATFSSESGSGWQTVHFAQPVAISANTVYVASYFAPVGNYAGTNNYFGSTGVNAGPLHAIKGVYHYGATGGFPNQTYLSSNYWVDVLFSA